MMTTTVGAIRSQHTQATGRRTLWEQSRPASFDEVPRDPRYPVSVPAPHLRFMSPGTDSPLSLPPSEPVTSRLISYRWIYHDVACIAFHLIL